MLSFSREHGKSGCEGCWFNDKMHCPGENDNGKLLKQEDRICYNKEKDEELILSVHSANEFAAKIENLVLSYNENGELTKYNFRSNYE